MGITLTTAARNALANALVDLCDAGSSEANGHLVILSAGDVEVAKLPLSNPAFGNSATGVATAEAITSDTSAAGGTAAKHVFQDRDDTEVWQGNVQTSGGDLNISSLTIGAGFTVSCSSYTVTQPAS